MDAPDDRTGPPPDAPAPALKVLYVDDDEGLGRLVQRHLGRQGMAVRLATDGEQGVALAGSERFDVVALDHYMPGRDGLEVLALLRGLRGAPPVVFVTAAEEPRIAAAALKAGAADYVIKDVHGAFLDLLASALQQAVEQVRLQHARDAALRELQESRDRLEKLAEQRAALLHEVNHRVGNSLQLITSLIGMQARGVTDAAARRVLLQAAERVEAVGMVHRRLYATDDAQTVALDTYLAGLAEELGRAAGDAALVRIEAEPVSVSTDQAVRIGLIVNEWVSNALKYAYPGGTGPVRIRLVRDGGVRLSVEDDGVGPPPPGAPPLGGGLGGTIVRAMADMLGGATEAQSTAPGARYVLFLPRC